MSVQCAVVQGIGGWNLRTDASSCPDSAPVGCGEGLQIRCCPSGTTCAGFSNNVCCPNGSDCAATIYNENICADPSWILWAKPGSSISQSNGGWCCESGHSGLYTSAGVLCLAGGTVPDGASVGVEVAQTSTCTTSTTSTTTSSSSPTTTTTTTTTPAVIVVTTSSSSSSSSSSSKSTRSTSNDAQTRTTTVSASSSSSSSSSTTQSNALSTTESDSTNQSGLSSTTKLGLGLGVALGVVLITLLIIAILFLRRRSRRRRQAAVVGTAAAATNNNHSNNDKMYPPHHASPAAYNMADTYRDEPSKAYYYPNHNNGVDNGYKDGVMGTGGKPEVMESRTELYGTEGPRHELANFRNGNDYALPPSRSELE